MKQKYYTILALFLVLPGVRAQTGAPRERILFDADWRFQKDDPAGTNDALSYGKMKDAVIASSTGFLQPGKSSVQPPADLGRDVPYTQPDFNDGGWRKLNLPHDWGIEGPFKQEYSGDTGKLPWWGVAWYRKHFEVAPGDQGKQLYLDVDGAMSYATVWLNGRFVGGWPYGYASWRLDLTPFIKPGGNVLAIRLDNPNNSSRWYPGGGIYRNVWLVKTAPVHVAQWGTHVTTPEADSLSATVNIDVALENRSNANAAVSVKTTLFYIGIGGAAPAALVVTSPTAFLSVGPVASNRVAFGMKVPNPRLWDLENPNLYTAVTTVVQDGRPVDRYETVFGIRTARFTADNGFLLNGKRVPIQGVCDHHDLGALGSAINSRALQRQIEILKSMGCNAIRTSHNPPAPELLEWCDRMGMLVMDEFVDCWKRRKSPNDYNLLFDDWSEKDIRALVRRDRNHPCVILWSIGNEINEQGRPEGPAMEKRLTAFAHEEDATRPTTIACSDTKGGYNGFQTGVDVFGYNYKPWEYKKFRAANPAIPLFGSETASTVSSRGEYFFPVSDNKGGGKSDFQVSSYDLYAPSWATAPDTEFKGQDANPFVAGEFVWTGFDYLGEPTPYSSDSTNLLNYHNPEDKARAEKELKELGKIAVPSRSSYFGIIDLAGFPKDRFYLYQARWRPGLPMAHILPHWNWPGREGETTPVHVYTSGDEAELFLNGKSLGRKKKGQYEYRLRWDDVKYEPGELKVIAYKNAQKWAEDTVKTTGPAAKIQLKADRDALHADGNDLAFVTAAVADANGLTVPQSRNLVHFDVSGPAELVATDNGDATSHVSFQSKDREAFNGLVLAIVRTKAGEPGQIKLTARAEGLQTAEVTVSAR